MARRPSLAIHSSSRRSLGLDALGPGELLLGEQAGLDPLGELDLLLGVQQRDLADLLEVVLDRVRRGAGGHDLLRGRVVVVGVGDREAGVLGRRRRRGAASGRRTALAVVVSSVVVLSPASSVTASARRVGRPRRRRPRRRRCRRLASSSTSRARRRPLGGLDLVGVAAALAGLRRRSSAAPLAAAPLAPALAARPWRPRRGGSFAFGAGARLPPSRCRAGHGGHRSSTARPRRRAAPLGARPPRPGDAAARHRAGRSGGNGSHREPFGWTRGHGPEADPIVTSEGRGHARGTAVRPGSDGPPGRAAVSSA